jgi:hypothetical protein
MLLIWIIARFAVLACMGMSVYFAYLFGFSKGYSWEMQVGCGVMLGAVDMLKPLFLERALTDAKIRSQVMCWACFVIISAASLWAAFGNTAIEHSKQAGAQIKSEQAEKDARAKLKRETDALNAMGQPTYTTQAVVDAAADALNTTKQRIQDEKDGKDGRAKGCGRECQAWERSLPGLQQALADAGRAFAATAAHAKQKAKVEAADEELKAVLAKTTTVQTESDPQAASLHKATGWNIDAIALFGHGVFALLVEIGSGAGFWLVFGHGDSKRREEPETVAAPAAASVAELVPIEAAAEAPDTPENVRKRFFQACLHHGDGKVRASLVYGAYLAWQQDPANNPSGIAPMSGHAFGKRSPWVAKKRIGGDVFYMGCVLNTPSSMKPSLRVVA